MFEDDRGSVLLGWPQWGAAVSDDDPYISKGGGRAAWLPGGEPPPPAAALCCANCGVQLFLVAQIYAPIDVPRVLYVFGCNRASCQDKLGR